MLTYPLAAAGAAAEALPQPLGADRREGDRRVAATAEAAADDGADDGEQRRPQPGETHHRRTIAETRPGAGGMGRGRR